MAGKEESAGALHHRIYNKFYEMDDAEHFSTTAQAVFGRLMNLKNRQFHPEKIDITTRELAKKVGCSQPTLLKAQRELVARGVIAIESDKSNPRAASAYRILDITKEPAKEAEQAETVKSEVVAPPEPQPETKPEEVAVPQLEPKPAEKVIQFPAASKRVSTNSPEVLNAWEDAGGVKLKGDWLYGMINLENQYGAKLLVGIIEEAGKANTYPRMNWNFFTKGLATWKRRAEANGEARRSLEQYDIIDDELPAEYRKYQGGE